jgi:branched-chain amino acid transport system substrate-binding protein
MLELKAWHAKKLTRRAFLKGLGSGLLAAGLDWNRTIFAQAQEELPIGILAPLVLDVGQSTVRGAELAAREINEAGGVLGRKIRLAVRDDQTSPQAAKLAFEDLVVNEGVVAILGEFLDEVMISLMPLIAQFKMPFIDTGSSMTATNEMVAQDYASYKYYFRAMFNTDILTMDMERVARDVFRDELGLKKVGLLLEEGIWGRDMQGFLEERLPQLGLSVTTVFFPLEQRDFGPMLTQLKDAGAEAMLVAFAYNDGINFVNLWYLTKCPIRVFGINVSGQAYEYWADTKGRVVSHVYADAATEATAVTPKTLPFYQSYIQTYRVRPVRPLYTAYATYDALHILKEAIERAGRADDPDLLVAELEKTDYVGTVGRLVFNGLDSPYPHDMKYGDEYVVPKWVQWQADVGGRGKREVIYPPQYRTSPYLPPPWLG